MQYVLFEGALYIFIPTTVYGISFDGQNFRGKGLPNIFVVKLSLFTRKNSIGAYVFINFGGETLRFTLILQKPRMFRPSKLIMYMVYISMVVIMTGYVLLDTF